MSLLHIRKIVIQLEEIHRDEGHAIAPSTLKAVAAAVTDNPFVDHYADDLEP